MPFSYASAPRPLIVTGSEEHLDAVLRLCAAAAIEPLVCAELATARPHWPAAPLVVLGDDVVAGPGPDLPVLERRRDVVVVVRDDPRPAVWTTALALGAEQVLVLPRDDDALAQLLADRADGSGRTAPVVAFVGGSGGAGASSLAASVARTAARAPGGRDADGDVLLVDGDPLGGGLDLLLGDEARPGLRWNDLAATHGRLSGTALRRSLPRADGLAVLSWERGARDVPSDEVVAAVLTAVRRAHALVVADLPRHLDAAAAEVAARAAVSVVVVSDDVRGVAAATSVVRRLTGWSSDIRLVVRRRRGGLPPALVAETLALPLLTTMSEDSRFRRAVEDGVGPVARRSSVRAAGRSVWSLLAPELAR
ncbi:MULTISPECIES: septum site-determining protein Ssd [Mumia]|uniref:Septum site-determining protein Ssd n=1 Tax=Mumia xiangluensis TaxID=1678900 RepID=A0ABW1QM01_9ACTN|nr:MULTISPECIES: septum site-determining protein Ssd [Mumia]